ncbi:hypothetical protein U9M48_030804 [Paspalum notatum var. saurae]|uniref:Reverse transcriptase domain-containing protein n=1 Tax=Paspalum notatum var. saurae TaxID=547442 RepID=A0AAQ3U3N7_PASNO
MASLGLDPLDLSALDEPFSEEEVLEAIHAMPADRAPGPDGFTGAFYKAGWSIIKTDILAALNVFHAGRGWGFEKLNNGPIVLLPKRSDAASPGDYRPIEMIHSFGKLISKILALRLAPFMQRLISANQNAYVRGRSILDSYKYVQTAAAVYRGKKIPKLLLKLDISKAFDSLAWSFLLEVLRRLGFSVRWCNWISTLLYSASSRILLNGTPGAAIQHRRGVRQGDSLSPLLFVIAMEVLNRLFHKAAEPGVLGSLGPAAVRSKCSLYADDVIVFMDPITREAEAIKALLQLFGDAAGMMINLNKCSLSPLSGHEPEFSDVVSVLGCQVAELPIKYLGLPLHSKTIPKSCVHGLVDKVASRLPAWRGALMARSGRLVWIRFVMTAVPIYAMMANGLPAWACEEIEACCRNPDECHRAWVELPLKIAPEVQSLFRNSVYFVVGNGQRVLFWQDNWIDGRSVEDVAPALLWFVSKRTKLKQTVAEALNGGQWIKEIRGGLTVPAVVQYMRLWGFVQGIRLTPSTTDKLVWKWLSDGCFSVRSAYRLLHEGSLHVPEVMIIWKTWAPLRVKIFLWLAWRRRIWTGDRRRRHGLDARESCFLCDDAEETCNHLMFECSFTQQVWDRVLTPLGLTRPSAEDCGSVLDWWQRVRALWSSSVRKGGDSLFIVAWTVWKERNARCFRGDVALVDSAVSVVVSTASEWVRAGASVLGALGCTFRE